jgi:dTDP-4-amino-4,6-dideoxygalactose transaminase
VEQAAVKRVLASGNLAQGTEVAAFEAEFSKSAASGRHCIAVNSGTSALHLTLVALGLGFGDEVIVPSFTFAATANCVAFTGANPVFVDINPVTFTIDPAAVEAAITTRTQGVMPVHLYGHPANMTQLVDICERYGLWLVEDAAQAHLASWNGRVVGTLSMAGSFSFYPTKNMTSGEGGMVVTGDEKLARSIRLLRNQGQERRYENEIVGLNNRMTDVHAAIGRVQLSSLAQRTAQRQANAEFFDTALSGVGTPQVDPRAIHVYHQYTIRVEGHNRDRFAEELAKRGVGSGVYYPHPVHALPAFGQVLDLPETERASREVLSLPVYPSLSDDERDQVVTAVNAIAGAGS